jgi:hypothetical protein
LIRRPARRCRPGDCEEGRLAQWREALERTRALPLTLATAVALDAWETVQPLERIP